MEMKKQQEQSNQNQKVEVDAKKPQELSSIFNNNNFGNYKFSRASDKKLEDGEGNLKNYGLEMPAATSKEDITAGCHQPNFELNYGDAGTSHPQFVKQPKIIIDGEGIAERVHTAKFRHTKDMEMLQVD